MACEQSLEASCDDGDGSTDPPRPSPSVFPPAFPRNMTAYCTTCEHRTIHGAWCEAELWRPEDFWPLCYFRALSDPGRSRFWDTQWGPRSVVYPRCVAVVLLLLLLLLRSVCCHCCRCWLLPIPEVRGQGAMRHVLGRCMDVLHVSTSSGMKLSGYERTRLDRTHKYILARSYCLITRFLSWMI